MRRVALSGHPTATVYHGNHAPRRFQTPRLHRTLRAKKHIMKSVRVVLVSTYEMGRQPFGLASPAAWLRAEGHQVTMAENPPRCSEPPRAEPLEQADLIGFYLPMHTATRLFLKLVGRVQSLNPRACLCAYGLYAPLNEAILRYWRGNPRGACGEVQKPEWRPLALPTLSLPEETADLPPHAPIISSEKLRFLPRPTARACHLSGKLPYAHHRHGWQPHAASDTPKPAVGCKHLDDRHCHRAWRRPFRIVQRRGASWRISGVRWPRARSTSPSATRISSTAPSHAVAIVETWRANGQASPTTPPSRSSISSTVAPLPTLSAHRPVSS